MDIKINKEVCIGCGTCAAICPDVFKIGADAKAEVIAGDYSGKEGLIQQAKDACSVQAIEVGD
ncbi:ferredoxin [Candidatus Falkowbacteria bacterium]|nr:ferredoxin [Candidatus Falkowbacteria bacterium]